MKSNIAITLANAKKTLRDNNIISSSIDAELIMMKVTGYTRVELLTKGDKPLTKEQSVSFFNMLKRLIKNEPLQYILNHQEFMGLSFYVDENVLIPRPDTEILVEACLEYLKDDNQVLDMCTGSGCISVSLSHFNKNINITAVDICDKALEIAKKNAKSNNTHKINFIKSDMFKTLDNNVKFDIIISNPPYIKTKEINELLNNVKDYEPLLALNGGLDGLDYYKTLAKESPVFLKNKGFILIEIGCNQKEDVINIFKSKGYEFLECRKDLKGLNRVLIFRR